MEKQKRIEEMANDLKQIKFNMQGCFIPQYVGVHEDITARDLYELGYRKIPEGSVVLTEEEFNEFQEDSAKVKFLKKEIRKKIVKEFAERLKSKMGVREYKGTKYKQGIFSDIEIDEIAKEMGVEL